jgi:hypothetical protein
MKRKRKTGGTSKGPSETAADTAPKVGQTGSEDVDPVELDLHGDAINHWRDEPEAPRRQAAVFERSGIVRPAHRDDEENG